MIASPPCQHFDGREDISTFYILRKIQLLQNKLSHCERSQAPGVDSRYMSNALSQHLPWWSFDQPQ